MGSLEGLEQDGLAIISLEELAELRQAHKELLGLQQRQAQQVLIQDNGQRVDVIVEVLDNAVSVTALDVAGNDLARVVLEIWDGEVRDLILATPDEIIDGEVAANVVIHDFGRGVLPMAFGKTLPDGEAE